MMAVIEIPSALQKYTDSHDEIEVSASTVEEAFNLLCQKHSALKQHLYDENGKIRSFINVYVNDEDIRYASNLQTKVTEGDSIQIVPSIAGGN
ncbi:MAG: MoaD/ThiS family protein [SAR324 cluster bacterium]|nr:MoaD/ThiS family protein [SAR324 cluster bacterium]MBF0350284.1 MoaD/ThiS family protein [SAR324 cluster bacterium]